jgi:hypothetical protein
MSQKMQLFVKEDLLYENHWENLNLKSYSFSEYSVIYENINCSEKCDNPKKGQLLNSVSNIVSLPWRIAVIPSVYPTRAL